MVLANDVVELLWPEPVGERVRRVFLEACGGEQARAARFGAGSSPCSVAVMPGLVPGSRLWTQRPSHLSGMAGTSPAMTREWYLPRSSAEYRGDFLPAAQDDDAPAAIGRTT